MAQWKSQHPLIKLVPQTAQHALADLPLLYVDVQFEPPIDQHESKKNAAQDDQIRDLIELHSHEFLWIFFSRNRSIDDQLWQIERIIEKWKRKQGHHDQIYLLPQAVTQDVSIDRWSEPVRPGFRQQASQESRDRRQGRSQERGEVAKKSHELFSHVTNKPGSAAPAANPGPDSPYPWQIVAPPGAREIQPADRDRKLITPSLFERPVAKLAAPEPFARIARSSFEYRRRDVDHAG